MIRAFVIASTPMVQAGLRTMLTSAEIQVVGESSLPDAFIEDLANIDVVVVADELLLEEVGRILANDSSVALVALAALSSNAVGPPGPAMSRMSSMSTPSSF